MEGKEGNAYPFGLAKALLGVCDSLWLSARGVEKDFYETGAMPDHPISRLRHNLKAHPG